MTAPNLTLTAGIVALSLAVIYAGPLLVLAVAKAALLFLACLVAASLICRERRS